MNKESTIVKEKNIFEIVLIINNTAYIKSITGKTGLLNIKTNQLIGKMDNYYTVYCESKQFYYQISQSSDNENQPSIKIYDALEEKTIVDGWTLDKTLVEYETIALKSPDNKIHLFSIYAYRNSDNIFDLALDEVDILYEYCGDIYFILTMNGKKGIYHINNSKKIFKMKAEIEFDDIEKMPNIVIYTKGDKKYFTYDKNDDQKSDLFDTISSCENNKNIIYCKKDDTIYVYNTLAQKLLLKKKCDGITLIGKLGDIYNVNYVEYFFKIEEKQKLGLVSSVIRNNQEEIEGKETILLENAFNSIEQPKYSREIFLEKNGQKGMFIGNSSNNQYIEPQCDDIKNLFSNYYGFYKDGFCDIAEVTPFSVNVLIKKCKIEQIIKDKIIYKKRNSFGILTKGYNDKACIIPAKYNNYGVPENNDYLILEKNEKKYLMYQNELINEAHDDIKLSGNHNNKTYIAYKTEEHYKLAKKDEYKHRASEYEFVSEHLYKEIDFLQNIMVLVDENCLYIYDYNEHLLKTFPSSFYAQIIEKKDIIKGIKYYCINDVWYYYRDGKFEEVPTEENEYYITTYETETDSFEAKTLNKQEHDSFCSFIDSLEDKEAEIVLTRWPENKNGKKYPTLMLKRIEKKQEDNQ